jgi:hypothetical protein
MSRRGWYSAKLRFAIMIAGKGSNHLTDSVYLFRAASFDAAFKRALAIGRKAETRYKNAYGESVAWKLMEIVTLDVIQARDLDGAQVCSDAIFLRGRKRMPARTRFAPERSRPAQSI